MRPIRRGHIPPGRGFRGDDDRCSHCRMSYKQFRTGHTYQEVFEFMMDYSDDANDWKRKTRATVLGRWFQIKQELWKAHIAECEMAGLIVHYGGDAVEWNDERPFF